VGDPEPLSSATPERRGQIQQQLRATLSDLAPFLDDAENGPLLRRALLSPGLDGVMAVDGKIVLTEWGLLPAGVAVPPDVLSASALAGYLPAPPVRASVRPATAAGAAPRTSAPPPLPIPESAVRRGAASSVWNWWLVPAAIAVAAVFLVLGAWLGARFVAERLAARPAQVELFDEAPVRAALDRQREQNAALQAQIEERKRSLGGDVCVADPAQLPQIGPNRAGVVPPGAAPAPPGAPPFHGTLAELLTQGVVMVLAVSQTGTETGSGFFVTPDLVVTNRHVVEDAQPGKLFVTGGKLTRATPAQVVAQSPNSEIGSLDVALLRVTGATGVQPLVLSTTAAPLDQVIAAGYPGLTLETDAAYQRLIDGDASAIPSVILTDGRINAIQTSSAGLKIMPHTAAIAPGNSGGPLADACGRVIGINTFINVDTEHAAQTRYAQKIDAVVDFLKSHGVEPTVATDACAAGGGPGIAAPAAPAQPAAAQPAAAQPAAAATPPAPATAPPVPPAPAKP
jgi:S1-C subfamily serine protease